MTNLFKLSGTVAICLLVVGYFVFIMPLGFSEKGLRVGISTRYPQIKRNNASFSITIGMNRTSENGNLAGETLTPSTPSGLMIHHNGKSGRLGNTMFAYASMIGIAHLTKRIPTFENSKFKILETFFSNAEVRVLEQKFQKSSFIKQKGLFTFDEKLTKDLPPKNIIICCWLASYKYFHAIDKEIRHHFTIPTVYKIRALDFLKNITRSAFSNSSSKCTFIGVHIRIRDRISRKNIELGFRIAPAHYLRTAMEYFAKKYENACFIICSDKWTWVDSSVNLTGFRTYNSIFSLNERMEDLALLSLCNHSIMTVGTYGWWASHLTGGEIVYYHPQVNPNAWAGKYFTRSDFYPPEWKCFTDDPYVEKLQQVRQCHPSEQ